MGASTSDFEVSAARRKWWIAGVGAGAVVAVAAVVAFAFADSSTLDTATSFGAPFLSAVVPAPSASAPSVDDSVALTLTADTSIESVRAMGTRSVTVQGAHARLVVAKWDGVLGIDAVLKGGRVAHVDANASSGRDLKLVTTPKAAPPTAPHPPAATAAPTSELQSNPYGH